VEVVASLSQGRTAAAQCGLFTYKSVPVIFEPPCNNSISHPGLFVPWRIPGTNWVGSCLCCNVAPGHLEKVEIYCPRLDSKPISSRLYLSHSTDWTTPFRVSTRTESRI